MGEGVSGQTFHWARRAQACSVFQFQLKRSERGFVREKSRNENASMKIHEYQAKAILSKYGVAVPRGAMVESREAAERAAKDLMAAGATGVVVKAQIHAGGRGMGGGVKIAKSYEQAAELAGKILGMQLVTHQTGPEGKKVRRLLIEETLPIASELYLGIVLDRAVSRPVFMASKAGGMEIEEVAAKDPDAIIKEYIDPAIGFQPFQARKIAFKLGLKPEFIAPAVKFMLALYKAYEETDASLFEINPFITTTDGRVFALDAKVNFDDNALYRHTDEMSCATSPRKIRSRWKPASTTSTTSSWTAPWAAW